MFFPTGNFWIKMINAMLYIEHKPRVAQEKGRSYSEVALRRNIGTVFEIENQKIELKKPSIILIPAYTDYIRYSESEKLFSLHFRTSTKLAKEIKVFYPADIDKFEKYFYKAFNLWETKDFAYILQCTEYLMHILYMICREEAQREPLNFAIQAALLIEKNLTNKYFNIESLAQKMNVSGTYLRRKFIEQYNVPPKEYLTDKRLDLAISLLRTKYYNIKQTAQKCGFEDSRYFSTVFKKHFGESPNKYLKRL